MGGSPTFDREVSPQVEVSGSFDPCAVEQTECKVHNRWVEEVGDYTGCHVDPPIQLVLLPLILVLPQILNEEYQCSKCAEYDGCESVCDDLAVEGLLLPDVADAAHDGKAVEGDEQLERAGHEGEHLEGALHLRRPAQVEVLHDHYHLDVVREDTDQHGLGLVTVRRTQD